MVIEDGHHLIFTYGTLKKGFWNHTLMQDLITTGDAIFKGTYSTVSTYPLVCGPFKVPFLLNFQSVQGSSRISGELYSVSSRGLDRIDELEGTTRGHYERLPIEIVEVDGEENREEEDSVWAEAYYAHRSYAAEMLRREGRRVISEYTEKEAMGYVKRKDRPKNLSFLEHIHLFTSSSSPADDDSSD